MPNFIKGLWETEINTRDFIQLNYTPYDGGPDFLAKASDKSVSIWEKLKELQKEEQRKGILDLDVNTPSTIVSHPPGYIDKVNEVILGLQTDSPLKRAIKPTGGIRLVEQAAEAYGYKIPENVVKIFSDYRKTHNDGVFSAYTDDIKLLRHHHVLTGLPDNYGRGRIIGDYRRLPLYGTKRLIEEREEALRSMDKILDEDTIRLREELNEHIKALKEIEEMSKSYGFDVTKPASDSKEAVQWLYLAYLAAVKQQDGAAMSIGKLDAFLDIYFERDLAEGRYTEEEIQELVDQFVIKLRIVRHLRTPDYDQLFAGDPTWVTLVLGGTGLDGRSLVTKTSFRFLHTLTNLGPAPEPNLTVLWGEMLPRKWKEYAVSQSILSSSIQYENDDLMKPYYGDDYGIACCVSGMAIGKEMQFFGARSNIAKALLLAINGGKEEPRPHLGPEESEGGIAIIPGMGPLRNTELLQFDEIWERFKFTLDWLAERYVKTMNAIHYMHDKYFYESSEMAFHNPHIKRYMAFGAAGLSVVTDSLSAIKYAKVKPVWNEKGVAEKYIVEGEFPKYGNDDDRVDQLAVDTVRYFITALRKNKTYRDSVHTLSILTITSNVVYGKATGCTPDGRESGKPFAPGANPMHDRDSHGAIASLNSVAKIPYDACQDGVSNTFSIVPETLGRNSDQRVQNLAQMLDGYFAGKGGHHLNINVFTKETLLDAQQHPEKYPQLTIRVSGYAVLFNRLSREQQDEVIARTFHSNF